MNAGPAIHVETSETYGRGAGDGMFGITNLRIIFIIDRDQSGMAIEREFITAAKKNWISLPGSSNLRLETVKNGQLTLQNFYCPTLFIKELLEELS